MFLKKKVQSRNRYTMKSKPLKLLGVMSLLTVLIVVVVSQCIHMSNLTRLYPFNMCRLLYVNYTTIKRIFKKPLRLQRTQFLKSKSLALPPSAPLQTLPRFILLECSSMHPHQADLVLTEAPAGLLPCPPFQHLTPWVSSVV